MDFANQLLSLPVLSVRQPWASYLVSGLKTVELRSWVPASRYAGWLWVHTGKKADMIAMRLLGLDSAEFQCGGLVGLAKVEKYHLIDSQTKWQALRGEHLSPGYYEGLCYGWEVSEVLTLPEIIECPGELGLFQLRENMHQQAYREITSDQHEEFIQFARETVTPQPLCPGPKLAPVTKA